MSVTTRIQCPTCLGRGTINVSSPGIDEWDDCWRCGGEKTIPDMLCACGHYGVQHDDSNGPGERFTGCFVCWPKCFEYTIEQKHECEWGDTPHLRIKVDMETGSYNYPCMECGFLNHVTGSRPWPDVDYWKYGSHADFCDNCEAHATPYCLN